MDTSSDALALGSLPWFARLPDWWGYEDCWFLDLIALTTQNLLTLGQSCLYDVA